LVWDAARGQCLAGALVVAVDAPAAQHDERDEDDDDPGAGGELGGGGDDRDDARQRGAE